jgi:signal transduction histidine kinase
MARRSTPKKTTAEGKRAPARKTQEPDAGRVRDLEARLAEALQGKAEAVKREAEAQEQQAATAEILRVISSSPTDVQPVFDAIVRTGARLCEAEFALLARYDGTSMSVAAHSGAREEEIDAVGQVYPMRPTPETLGGRAILERAVVHIPDVSSDPTYGPRAIKDAGWRTGLGIPLLREGAAVGAVGMWRRDVRPFSDRQIALLQTFADQAVIAIENARLFKELEVRNRDLTEALEQQTATSEVLKVISGSTFDLGPVLETLVESATRLCGATRGHIFRFDGEVLRFAAAHGAWPGFTTYLEAHPARPGRGSVAGRAAAERRVIHVHDVTAEADYEYGGLLAQQNYRTVLAVPMLREGTLLGVIVILKSRVEPFADKQIDVVTTFADQAVIAIENVRLFTELQTSNRELTTALEQQTATSEILRAITHAPTDTQPVFDTIVRSAATLCHAAVTAVFLTDGQMVFVPANYGSSSEALGAVRARFPRPLGMESSGGAAILTRSVVHVPDIEEPSVGELVRQNVRRLGVRSLITVPMLRGGVAVGAIGVYRREPGRFSSAEVTLLQTFADQAVIAIENVRLFTELQARTGELTRSVEELTALGDVSRALSATLDLDAVLQTIVTRANQLAGTDACTVYEYDGQSETFVMRATHNLDEAVASALRRAPIRRGDGAVGRVAVTREPVQIADIALEGAYHGALRDLLLQSGTRALLAIPLLREDQVVGGLTVNKRAPGEFSPEVVELLKTFGTQSALAIQNAQLFREIADKSRQLEAASRHKSEFLANMSHELRTPLNAVLGFSEVLLQRMFGNLNPKQDEYLKDIYSSGQHLLSLINDILDLSKIEAGRMELAPAPFHLPSALDNAVTLVKERAARHGITLQVDVDPRLGEIAGDERKVKQVLLNLLSNAVKFTPEGGRISLRASRKDGAVEIAVTDTGVGIAPEDQAAIFEEFRQVGHDETRKQEGTGLGLTLAKKFVELHGGRIWVESQPDRGSTFIFRLPGR